MLVEEGEESFNEGCLKYSDVRGDVYRNEKITIRYYDENFNQKTRSL
jgi:peptide deformylase